MFKKVYQSAITKQQSAKPYHKQGELYLKRLTIKDFLTINLTFCRLYNGGLVSADLFLLQLILMCSLCDQNKEQLFNLASVDLDGVLISIDKISADSWLLLPRIAKDYTLAKDILNTPPVPRQGRRVEYNQKETIQAIKNNYLVIDAMIRTFLLETKTPIDTPLIDFAVIAGALIINGGLTQAERIATSLKRGLDKISYNLGVGQAFQMTKPHNTNELRRLNNSHSYFEQTPIEAILAIRTKAESQLLSECKTQMHTMARLKTDRTDRYKELIKNIPDNKINNLKIILEGTKEFEILQTIIKDAEAV